MPCDLVRHFQVLHFHPSRDLDGPSFSGRAFSQLTPRRPWVKAAVRSGVTKMRKDLCDVDRSSIWTTSDFTRRWRGEARNWTTAVELYSGLVNDGVVDH